MQLKKVAQLTNSSLISKLSASVASEEATLHLLYSP